MQAAAKNYAAAVGMTLTLGLTLCLAGCPGGGLSAGGGDSPAGGGDYSILLMGFSGASHVEASQQILESIRTHTGWKDIFLVHKENHSEIYRGHYRTPAAAEDDLELAKEYVARQTGAKPFQRARIVSASRQAGPPEWNILNAKGYYTLLVADYFDVPEANYVGRREFAVARCQELREQGYEAYYHHDPAHSQVMVGAFPREAAEMEIPKAYDMHDRKGYLPRVIAGQPKFQIKDRKMADIVSKMSFSVNGNTSVFRGHDAKTGGRIEVPEPPRVVVIPGREEEAAPIRAQPSTRPGPAPLGPPTIRVTP